MGKIGFEHLRELEGPILISGHSGFKGTWLTLLLESIGFSVRGVALKPARGALFSSIYAETDSNLGNWIDIRNSSELTNFLQRIKPSYIFHLAAQAIVTEGYRDPVGTFETNVMGTANLLQGIRNCESVAGVTIVTTDKVYRNHNTGNKFVENDPLEGIDPYSASKVGTEAVVTAWRNIYKLENEIPVNVVRAGNIIGGGDFSKDRLIPDLIRSVEDRKPALIRYPDNTRPWQHVLDPLLGYLIAANLSLKDKKHLTLNFGPTENALSVQEVALLAQENWSEIDFRIQPSNELYESQYLDLDSTLATDLTGWKPMLNQKAAVEMTIDWWKRKILKGESPKELCLQDIEKVW